MDFSNALLNDNTVMRATVAKLISDRDDLASTVEITDAKLRDAYKTHETQESALLDSQQTVNALFDVAGSLTGGFGATWDSVWGTTDCMVHAMDRISDAVDAHGEKSGELREFAKRMQLEHDAELAAVRAKLWALACRIRAALCDAECGNSDRMVVLEAQVQEEAAGHEQTTLTLHKTEQVLEETRSTLEELQTDLMTLRADVAERDRAHECLARAVASWRDRLGLGPDGKESGHMAVDALMAETAVREARATSALEAEQARVEETARELASVVDGAQARLDTVTSITASIALSARDRPVLLMPPAPAGPDVDRSRVGAVFGRMVAEYAKLHREHAELMQQHAELQTETAAVEATLSSDFGELAATARGQAERIAELEASNATLVSRLAAADLAIGALSEVAAAELDRALVHIEGLSGGLVGISGDAARVADACSAVQALSPPPAGAPLPPAPVPALVGEWLAVEAVRVELGRQLAVLTDEDGYVATISATLTGEEQTNRRLHGLVADLRDTVHNYGAAVEGLVDTARHIGPAIDIGPIELRAVREKLEGVARQARGTVVAATDAGGALMDMTAASVTVDRISTALHAIPLPDAEAVRAYIDGLVADMDLERRALVDKMAALVCAASDHVADLADRIAVRDSAIDDLNAEVKAREQRIAALEEEKMGLGSIVDRKDDAIEDLSHRLTTATDELDRAQERGDCLENAVRVLRDRVVAVVEIDPALVDTQLDLLSDPARPDEHALASDAIERFTNAHNVHIAELEAELDGLKESISTLRDDLDDAYDENRRQAEELDAADRGQDQRLREKDAMLKAAEEREKVANRTVEAQQVEISEHEAAIARLEAEMADMERPRGPDEAFAELDGLTDSVAHMKSTLSRVGAEYDTFKDTLTAIQDRARVTQAGWDARASELRGDLEETMKAVRTATLGSTGPVADSSGAIESLQQEVKEQRLLVSTLRTTIKTLESDLEIARASLNTIRAESTKQSIAHEAEDREIKQKLAEIKSPAQSPTAEGGSTASSPRGGAQRSKGWSIIQRQLDKKRSSSLSSTAQVGPWG
ncbi:hypothetical protein J8273_5503 [Carpediemonas membranifera]|uniref:Uncharacterized protein n=1 Tax=Carpediemonas membranifera TaxID=201153 RepID=A0A8J6E105_9EUKA|nr:hypothetical protein J8273_5503 [Carpediemonas membranifera]|eukprot:KAG9392501.1 hypothetical protein J8273_5503 [Carpediemonas membranifera]